MSKKSKNLNKLREMMYNELQAVVEALLFASSCEVCANWSDKKAEQFIDIALSLKKDLGIKPSKDIEYDDLGLGPEMEFTKKLVNGFPEIVKKRKKKMVKKL